MKVNAIIQARMGSSRLPGKTLAIVGDQPLLLHVIERTAASQRVSEVIVATTTEPEDDAIVDRVGGKCRVYRGSVNDVLDRYYQSARMRESEIVVRITADDPFKDPDVVDQVIAALIDDPGLDYASNTLTPTYPEGLDVEAVRFKALERAWHEAKLSSDREHVTPYIWRQPHLFKTANVAYSPDLSSLRWTIDYEQDLTFAREIYQRLGQNGRIFRMQEILDLLEREPHLRTINNGFVRNAGYQKSLAEDTITIGTKDTKQG